MSQPSAVKMDLLPRGYRPRGQAAGSRARSAALYSVHVECEQSEAGMKVGLNGFCLSFL
jgi:hypothetical protein